MEQRSLSPLAIHGTCTPSVYDMYLYYMAPKSNQNKGPKTSNHRERERDIYIYSYIDIYIYIYIYESYKPSCYLVSQKWHAAAVQVCKE